jgi:transcription initiation factor IIE alpha subunit
MSKQFHCQACGETLESDSEDHLVEEVHSHAHDEHGKHMSEEEIKESIEEA